MNVCCVTDTRQIKSSLVRNSANVLHTYQYLCVDILSSDLLKYLAFVITHFNLVLTFFSGFWYKIFQTCNLSPELEWLVVLKMRETCVIERSWVSWKTNDIIWIFLKRISCLSMACVVTLNIRKSLLSILFGCEYKVNANVSVSTASKILLVIARDTWWLLSWLRTKH